jgi:predicted dehydrogenase
MTKVGIVGLGRVGHSFGLSPAGDPLSHSEGFAQQPDVAIAWGVDPDPDRRRAFASRFAGAATFASTHELAEADRVDIACICSPTTQHDAGLRDALRIGARVVVCEKPLAPTAAAAQSIVERCRAAGSTLVVNYSRRFSQMLNYLRAAAGDRGVLAGPVSGTIRYDGGFVHNGTHWIDLCRAMFGDVLEANGVGDADPDVDVPRTVELRFAGDRTVLLRGVTGTAYSVAEGEFLSRSGAVRFAESGAVVSVSEPADSDVWPGYRKLGAARVITSDGITGVFTELARHAVALAREGGAPACSGEDGVAALLTVERALSSLAVRTAR